MREGRAGERANEQAHSLSRANAYNPYYEHTPLARDNTGRVFRLVFHLAPTHLGWDTQRKIYSLV
jgi:phosphodiesterase/alkaline phosphatase D-like protein